MQDRPKKNCTVHQKKMTNHQELIYKFLQEWISPQWSKENINLISWQPIVQKKYKKRLRAASTKKHCNRNDVKRIKFSLQRISAKFYTCAFPSNGITTVGRMKCQEYHSGKCFPTWNENTLPEERKQIGNNKCFKNSGICSIEKIHVVSYSADYSMCNRMKRR